MILKILKFPHKRLRIKAKEVVDIDENIKTLVCNMFETMKDEGGVGLAATQVDRHLSIFVADVNSENPNPLCFINPKIIKTDGLEINEEGCLSIPEYRAEVERFTNITVTAQNIYGEIFECQATGLLSICIQHEMDHLNGVLFIDYLSKLKQQRVMEKFKKLLVS